MGDKCRQIFKIHDTMLMHHYCLFRLHFNEFQFQKFGFLITFFDLLKFLIFIKLHFVVTIVLH